MIDRSQLKTLIDLKHAVAKWGAGIINFFTEIGGINILLVRTFGLILRGEIRWRSTVDQMFKVGVTSLPLVFLTSLFTGMVLALQSAYQLRLFTAQQFTADLVALSICRELGPVLTAMVVAGRVGASIAAELGTMKVTEQIDALKSLAMDPIEYLAVPRFLAAICMLFALTIYADLIGMLGGYLVSVFKLGISSHEYIKRSIDSLQVKDVMTGLIKAFFFGGIISIVGCYYGFNTKDGAEGVGRATTYAVVVALIAIIASDVLFTAIFYFF